MSRARFFAAFHMLLFALAASRADAVQRAHVSALAGSDSNTSFNCDVAHPCRFFQAATTVVDPNGEVVVLDSGGYGAVTITQSVSLIAPTGVYAGISVFPGATGITIATPGVDVTLRGISINSQGGNNGIYMTAGARLTVENCVISNFGGGNSSGVFVGTAAMVAVRDTALHSNHFGIFLNAGATATITRTTVAGNASSVIGIYVKNTIASTTTRATITDTTLSVGSFGILGESTTAPTAEVRVSVIRSTVTRNVYGVVAQSYTAPVVVTVSETMVTNNDTGLARIGWAAELESLGNNTVRQNVNNTLNISTVVPM